MGLFLTETELQELTGYKLASKQGHWLKCHGYYLECNVRGIPRITYTQIEEMRRQNTLSLGNVLAPITHCGRQELASKLEPDFAELREKIHKRV